MSEAVDEQDPCLGQPAGPGRATRLGGLELAQPTPGIAGHVASHRQAEHQPRKP